MRFKVCCSLLVIALSALRIAHAEDTNASGRHTEEVVAASSDTAAQPPLFPGTDVQGEYEGHIIAGGTKYPIGVRILALGDGKFRSVAYVGGLPGSGEDTGRKIVTEATRSDDGTVTFRSDRSVTVWKEGVLFAKLGDREFEFKRIERRSPTLGKKPPKNATVLFGGKSASKWKNGVLKHQCLLPGAITRQKFGDFRLHVEFRVPLEAQKEAASRGNSGIVIGDNYELQILDSFGLKSKHDVCGGLVNIKRPGANMSFPPEAWQTFDIEFNAAKFSADDKLLDPPLLSVRHNGVYIHKDVELPLPDVMPTGLHPIRLEEAGSEVLFRNVWVISE